MDYRAPRKPPALPGLPAPGSVPSVDGQTCDPVRASELSLVLPGTRHIDTPPPGLSRAVQDTWVRRGRGEEEIRRPFSAQLKGESGEVYSKLRSHATLSPPQLCYDVHPAWRPEAHWPPTASRLPRKSADKAPLEDSVRKGLPSTKLSRKKL